MFRRSFCCVFAALLGCSSSEFAVGATDTDPEVAVADSAVTPDGDEASVDATPDPCAPEPGKSKFCLAVKVLGEHPPYDSGSGASDLKIDGKGKLYIVLFDKDPLSVPDGMPAAVPIETITYPSDAAELDIDKDLPMKLPLTASKPGIYSALAFFADSTKVREKGDKAVLPGDFVILPTVSGMTFSYPKLTLAEGKTSQAEMGLRAVRAATLTLTAHPDLKKYPTVHGDGPVLFGLHDSAAITSSTAWIQLSTGGCVDLDVDAFSPKAQQVTFGTTADTAHNIFAAVFDYSADKPEFPGKGTLISAQSGVMPRLEISKTAWTASANVELKDLAFAPMEVTAVDTLKCP